MKLKAMERLQATQVRAADDLSQATAAMQKVIRVLNDSELADNVTLRGGMAPNDFGGVMCQTASPAIYLDEETLRLLLQTVQGLNRRSGGDFSLEVHVQAGNIALALLDGNRF